MVIIKKYLIPTFCSIVFQASINTSSGGQPLWTFSGLRGWWRSYLVPLQDSDPRSATLSYIKCVYHVVITIAFSEAWTQVLHSLNRARSVSEVCDSENLWQWSRLKMRLLSLNHSAKIIHYHHHNCWKKEIKWECSLIASIKCWSLVTGRKQSHLSNKFATLYLLYCFSICSYGSCYCRVLLVQHVFL